MNSRSYLFGLFANSLAPRFWRVLLLGLLLAGQVLLLDHTVRHQLEDAITPDKDHCTYCAIGSHGAAAVSLPPLVPPTNYVLLLYLALGTAVIAGFPLFAVRLRGPPSSLD